jgi:hypothetical protein
MQQKSVNFLWTAQTKLTCKNYFSNNLQEVKWVIWIFSAKEKKRIFVILWIFGKRFYFIQRICILIYICMYIFNKIHIKNGKYVVFTMSRPDEAHPTWLKFC